MLRRTLTKTLRQQVTPALRKMNARRSCHGAVSMFSTMNRFPTTRSSIFVNSPQLGVQTPSKLIFTRGFSSEGDVVTEPLQLVGSYDVGYR